jgi:predicted 2-oxoglutarate/Fe(II)-dependent dioxygenase YbiX
MGRGYSVQHLVLEDIVGRYQQIDIDARAGDVVFCHSNLVHKSGTNLSRGIRFTAIVRYHQMLTSDFQFFPQD